MHSIDLILTFTGSLAVALFFGFFSHKIGLSPIVGYLLAGIVVSPNTPGYVANRDLAKQMAEIGVILLLFGVGLHFHFHFKELLAVRRIAIPGAVVQSTVATVLSMLIMRLFGWSWAEGAVFGMAIAVASTVVLTRILADNNQLHTPTGHIAIGWLVVEDIFTVFVLVLIPAIFGQDLEVSGGGIAVALLWTTLKIGALVACIFVLGGWLIPRVLTLVARTGSRELFTLCILVLALGIAVGSAKVFGVSMELGAFLAGMVVGKSEFSNRAATDALPMRDAFAVLFFVSVGMLFDFDSLMETPWLAVATVGIVVVGKPLAAIAITSLMRYPLRTSLAVGAVLSQIGEFSFIVGTMGMQHGLVSEKAFNILVATAIISITLSPLLYRGVEPLERWITKFPRIWKLLNRGRPGPQEISNHAEEHDRRAVVVGHGPVGRTLVRLLRENEFHPVVVEMNVDTVQFLRATGTEAYYGDASHIDTLRAADIRNADILILSSSGFPMGDLVIRNARELNPGIHILARTTYLTESEALLRAGADGVFSGEGEVALSMTESILASFGATAEQIERASERTRRELFPRREAGV